MCKIVILNIDFESIKILCNCIINQFPDAQLSGICTSLEEFDYSVSKIKPNIIIMNYSDFINSSYCKSECKIPKIIFYNSIPTLRNSSTQLFVSKNISSNEIKSISEFISRHDHYLLRKKIIKILENFRFDFKLNGTTYLLESILYCYENKTDYVFENLEKNVYPYVAEKCHTTDSKVKWSISRATDNMNTHLSNLVQKQISNSLNLDISDKPSAKQFITAIVTKLS